METVYIALVVSVVIIGILLLWPTFSCENYKASNTAKFTVSRPKQIIPNNFSTRTPHNVVSPVNSQPNVTLKEGFILNSSNLVPNNQLSELKHTMTTDNYWMGQLPNEMEFGVSVAVKPTTTSSSMLSVPRVNESALWSTII